jgi:hypothetical protein
MPVYGPGDRMRGRNDDHPLTRRQTTCPFCYRHKDPYLVACWPCFRSSGLKNGDKDANERLDNFEDFLSARERLESGGAA